MAASVSIEGVHGVAEPPVEGLAQLIAATTEHDGHRPIGEHALVELQASPREFPHAAFVARCADELAGYAHLSHRETQLGWRFDHTAADGGGAVRAWAYDPGPAQARIAARFGMRHVRTIERMHRSLPGPPVELPARYRLRAIRSDDVATWLQAHNEVFADHADGGNWREAIRCSSTSTPRASRRSSRTARSASRRTTVTSRTRSRSLPGTGPDRATCCAIGRSSGCR